MSTLMETTDMVLHDLVALGKSDPQDVHSFPTTVTFSVTLRAEVL